MKRHLNSTERDTIKVNNISEENWITHYSNLWTNEDGKDINPTLSIMAEIDLIGMDELDNALKTSKNKKASGVDNINIELLKYMPDNVKRRFLEILNICWKTCRIPEEWKRGKIFSIFKKGNRNECQNYRGICLLNTSYKIFSKIITRRLNIISEYILTEEQNGFRKGRSCSDCIFVIEQIIQKRREFNLPTYMLFIDYEKAFDRLIQRKLWEIMNERGYPEHLIRVIQSLYFATYISINNSDKLIKTNQGVKQGCPMSPALFSIYIDDVIRQWQEQLNINFKINDKALNTILFADDQVIFGNTEDELQLAVHKLNDIASNYNMKISEKKTKVMAFQGTNHLRCKIIINTKTIEQVNNFNYLGFNVSYCQKNDINIKINRFQGMCGTIRRTLKNKTLRTTQLKFYKTMAVPMLTYACENWTLNRSDKRKIETAEMKFLRSVAGYTLLDKKHNEEIRTELKIYNVKDKINQIRTNWLQHVERMPQNRLPQTLLKYQPKGRRNVGRPITRWRDSIS